MGDSEENRQAARKDLRYQMLQLDFLLVRLRQTLGCSASSADTPQSGASEREHDRSVVTPICTEHRAGQFEIVVAGPPLTATLRSALWPTKPIPWPSGENNGLDAPSLPAIGTLRAVRLTWLLPSNQ